MNLETKIWTVCFDICHVLKFETKICKNLHDLESFQNDVYQMIGDKIYVLNIVLYPLQSH